MDNVETLKKKICDALMEANDKLPDLRNKIENKDLILFLGNTRSGKSTLINYILGTKIQSVKIRKNSYKIKKEDKDDFGPCIGQGKHSTTDVLEIYEGNGKILVDTPGFEDNRGAAQSIINGILYINQIKYAMSCKFVLVVDINDITNDNAGNFLTSISRVNELIPYTENLEGSIALVLTKDNNNYSRDEITEELEHIISNTNLSISKRDRQLIRCFIRNKNVISFFNMPTCEGSITNAMEVDIQRNIFELSPHNMSDFQVELVVSNDTRVTLFDIFRQLFDKLDFNHEMKYSIKKYKDLNIKSLKETTEEALLQAKKDFNGLHSKLNLNQSSHITPHEIFSIMMNLVELDTSGDFHKVLSLLIMLDDVKLMNLRIAKLLHRKFKNCLEELRSCVDEAVKEVSDELEDRNVNKISIIAGAASGTAIVGGAGAALAGQTVIAATTIGFACTGVGTICIAGGAITASIVGGIQIWRAKKREEKRKLKNSSNVPT